MLMTVKLVNDFRVASRRVVFQAVTGPEAALPSAPRDRIAMPVDLGTKLDAPEAQQLDFMPAKPIGLMNRAVDPVRKLALDEVA